jgi:hypothetical protein
VYNEDISGMSRIRKNCVVRIEMRKVMETILSVVLLNMTNFSAEGLIMEIQ